MRILLFGIFCLAFWHLKSQYPQHFVYDDERNLPSNEVYSIVQDQRGFIWIGCDAGLYKFDGVRFHNYLSASQTSKSISGLVFNQQGTLFCYNFSAQLFYLEQNTLREIQHDIKKILSLTVDQNGNPWVNHELGISKFDLKNKTWTLFKDFGVHRVDAPKHYSHSARMNSKGEMCFISTEGISFWKDGKSRSVALSEFENEPPGRFKMEVFGSSVFVIATDGSSVIEEKKWCDLSKCTS